MVFGGRVWGTSEVDQIIDEAKQTAELANETIGQLEGELDEQEGSLSEQEQDIAELNAIIADLLANEEEITILPAPEATAEPVATEPVIPDGAIFVIVVKNSQLGVFEAHAYNDAGRPIMVKVQSGAYLEGEAILVLAEKVKSDGGKLFYEIVGPRYAGMYVLADQVEPVE
jgi:hypothetical protein